jgi:hypothetical protein
LGGDLKQQTASKTEHHSSTGYDRSEIPQRHSKAFNP